MDEDRTAKELANALIQAVREQNEGAVKSMMEAIVNPLLQRMDRIGQAQVTLAAGLRTVRRDRNATEMAKVLVEHFLRKDGELSTEIIHLIGDHAYSVANEMETHALVAEIQAQGQMDRVASHVKKEQGDAPISDVGTLARSFLGRKPQA